MRLVRSGDGVVVAGELREARTFLRRLRGLMGRRALADDEGLWIEPCSSVHMMFVPFPIDVLFARRADDGAPGAEVISVRAGVRAWIGVAWCRGASVAVELAAGRAAAVGVRPGDGLRLEAA